MPEGSTAWYAYIRIGATLKTKNYPLCASLVLRRGNTLTRERGYRRPNFQGLSTYSLKSAGSDSIHLDHNLPKLPVIPLVCCNLSGDAPVADVVLEPEADSRANAVKLCLPVRRLLAIACDQGVHESLFSSGNAYSALSFLGVHMSLMAEEGAVP